MLSFSPPRAGARAAPVCMRVRACVRVCVCVCAFFCLNFAAMMACDLSALNLVLTHYLHYDPFFFHTKATSQLNKGFYDVFDAEGFVKCSSSHGKSLRKCIVSTQMFVVLVEERHRINVRRLNANMTGLEDRFIGREAALFFEKCCIECRKKAVDKSLSRGAQRKISAMLEYPGTEHVGSRQQGDKTMSSGRKANAARSASKEVVTGKSGTINPTSCDKRQISNRNSREVTRGVKKVVKMVSAGTGIGFGVGLLTGGPIGAIAGGVVGTGLSAAAAVAGGTDESSLNFELVEKGNGGEKNEEKKVKSVKRRLQPTIIARAQLHQGLGIGGKENCEGIGNRRPYNGSAVSIPGATMASLQPRKYQYLQWPTPLDAELLDLTEDAIPPELKEMQELSVADMDRRGAKIDEDSSSTL